MCDTLANSFPLETGQARFCRRNPTLASCTKINVHHYPVIVTLGANSETQRLLRSQGWVPLPMPCKDSQHCLVVQSPNKNGKIARYPVAFACVQRRYWEQEANPTALWTELPPVSFLAIKPRNYKNRETCLVKIIESMSAAIGSWHLDQHVPRACLKKG